jgi:hypothetical protein
VTRGQRLANKKLAVVPESVEYGFAHVMNRMEPGEARTDPK